VEKQMSHFTRIRTKLTNIHTVQEALENLGYSVESGRVRGYGGQEAQADLVVSTNTGYDIGFKQEGNAVVMVADLWGLRINREEFLNRVTQQYAYLTVVEGAKSQGWQMAAEENQEDGSIRLVLQRWA
jgi:hypothetical protein